MHELRPSKDALDAAIASGSTAGTPEQWDQLDDLIVTCYREREVALR